MKFKVLGALLALLTVALVMAGYSYMHKGLVYDQAHYQHGSIVYADNGWDYSKLDRANGRVDRKLIVNDTRCNNKDAAGRGFNNGRVVAVVRDRLGCGPGGNSIVVGVNLDGHDTCAGRSNGRWVGCGPNSGHH